MKKVVFLVTLSLLVIISLVEVECFEFHETELKTEEKLWELYERWQSHHRVSRSPDEKQKRFNVFKANAHRVNSLNKMDEPYKLQLNKFGDMTTEEFRSIYTGHVEVKQKRYLRANLNFMYKDVQDVPTSIDWREKGAVTAVKHQGECRGCWAFAAVAAVEGINFITTKKLVSLCAQQLIDCVSESQGCRKGIVAAAYDYIMTTGITTDKIYPYTAEDGQCDTEKESAPVVIIDGHEDVPENDEEALLKAVAHQPVSAAIEAAQDIMFYSGGVFKGKCNTDLNHAVTIVGYGTTPKGTKYWIVKNSWGLNWGEDGYIRMERGIRSEHGLCGIAMLASYPIKTSSTNLEDEIELASKDEL